MLWGEEGAKLFFLNKKNYQLLSFLHQIYLYNTFQVNYVIKIVFFLQFCWQPIWKDLRRQHNVEKLQSFCVHDLKNILGINLLNNEQPGLTVSDACSKLSKSFVFNFIPYKLINCNNLHKQNTHCLDHVCLVFTKKVYSKI